MREGKKYLICVQTNVNSTIIELKKNKYEHMCVK